MSSPVVVTAVLAILLSSCIVSAGEGNGENFLVKCTLSMTQETGDRVTIFKLSAMDIDIKDSLASHMVHIECILLFLSSVSTS